jgi:RNA polymerase sigma-70 factor (ECF subfamily)
VIRGKPIADEDVLAALMERYGRALGSYLLRRGAAPGDVEDLKQEVFAGLAKRSDLHRIENIEGYLWRTARNLLVSQARRAMLRPVLVSSEAYEGLSGDLDELSPERIALARERYRLFLAALEDLTVRQRTIVVLGKFEEFSGNAIAAHLGISLSLVEKEMRHALRFLKERLS